MANRTAIIIVNWNGRRHLADCYDALAAQTDQDFRVIFVDNGSTDDSVAYTQRRLPAAEIIALGENTGFAKANNLGITRALQQPDCQYIALLNNDTAVDPQWLARLTAAAEQHTSYASFACLMVYFNDVNRVDSAGHRLLPTGRVTNWGQRLARQDFSKPAEVFGPCAGAALYRREFFETVGLFDESLFAYYEDVDLNWRAVLRGLRCYYEPAAVVRHKGAGTSQGNRRFQILSFRNRLIINTKDLPTDFMFSHLFRYLGFELFMFAVLLLNGKFSAITQWWQARAGAQQSRKSIQAQRTISLAQLRAFEVHREI
ncbi:MAG: glycosyltransferase family 2 protein [Candidatus Kerfeldbacteria bacterium]|nr:glycosyltransferase family 2 protein [Candidatus Kerfeldbacteria bacterium]